ncbi:ClpP/crotonase-like domain-containing protein [Penicillium hordei]|uniref:ClpP/crotonase-like domain-containing protein n=1 Tax=Penicillium hordei TaxID=40994 RepID=A0AAD6H7C2_9EURO|nr:ClpP/crotonase-like domain-containing protein [Penicillium hordei]KAJ5617716.1 ClpP/crotonase-like domain-containing protein [Penicillium hordei]
MKLYCLFLRKPKRKVATSFHLSLFTVLSASSESSNGVVNRSTSVRAHHLLNSEAQVVLNRPQALNALCNALVTELNDALSHFDKSRSIGAIIITGSEKAFAAGADIKEIAELSFSAAYSEDIVALWSHLANNIRKPVIAAVKGYALGGGFELALMADTLYCTSDAMFGLPEIKLGVIPGSGGSQRLTRIVGKSKAMELILTGEYLTGKEAGEWGLAAKVITGGREELLAAAIKTAEKIASYGQIAVLAAKEVVGKSQELPLREGTEYERRLFHGLFGTADQKIGMTAFMGKKRPVWSRI